MVRRSSVSLLALWLSLGLLSLGLVACQQTQPQPTTPPPLPQDPLIQVYTNQNPATSYTEPYRKQTRSGDDLETVIVEAISAARSRVDVAVQEFRLPRIAQALLDRQKAGVKVRVILENTYSRPFSRYTATELAGLTARERDRYMEFQQLVDRNADGQLSDEEIQQGDTLVMLDRAKIPRLDDTADGSAGSNLMHHKFVVIDGRTVIATSANFTTSDVHGDFRSSSSRGNANNLLRIESSDLAALFTQEFDLMWGDGPGGKPDSKFGVKKPFRPAQMVMVGTTQVAVQFSPTSRSLPWSRSTNGLIAKTLEGATRSIQMALFVFSDQALVNRLQPLHQKGIPIQALIDPGFAYRPYSEALDMLGVALPDACQYEADNRVWQPPATTIGVPRLPPGDLLHHKFGLVDAQVVLTGSHNWTDAANSGNDETLLVVNNATVAAHFQREFERLYTNATLGVPSAIQKKAADRQQQCPQLQPRPTRPSSRPTPSDPSEESAQQDLPPKGESAIVPATHKSAVHNSQQPLPGTLVNLNTATQAELETLPGVGAQLAKRIIAARQKKQFASLDDLDRVSGVGPKLLQRLESRVTW